MGDEQEGTFQKLPSGRRRLLLWLRSPDGSAVMMVVLTAVIAFTGVVGIYLVVKGGADTQRMIDAAERQACSAQRSAEAAQGFAVSAGAISSKMNDAVGKLNDQADQMKLLATQASVSNQTLQAVQRAFVNFNSLGLHPTNISGAPVFQYVGEMANSGTTPAIEVVARRHYLAAEGAIPKGFAYPFDPTQDTLLRTVLGARGNGRFSTNTFPAMNLDMSSKKQNFVYGWIVYRDIFPRTKSHLTEFCIELEKMDIGKLPHPGADQILPVIAADRCPGHQCYDESCKDYGERIAEASHASPF